jgi:hypothetical protein
MESEMLASDSGGPISGPAGQDEAMFILQSLLCLMREKNLLSRADIEELCERVAMRAAQAERDPLPCCSETARHAASEMAKISGFIGRLYGGKHRRA